jgi:ZIP family zinc transporter
MRKLGASALWAVAIALSLVGGALAAAVTRLPPRLSALLTTFGGGLLLAAVALELVPEADELAGAPLTAAGFVCGALIFVGADAVLTRDSDREMIRRSAHAMAAGRTMRLPPGHDVAARGESIAAGLFVDGVPESVALGLTLARDRVGAALLAGILIGNVVEAYGAAQPIIAGGHSSRFAVGLMSGIGIALGVATILGGTVLADVGDRAVGSAQALAAGAVLAVVSISVIPHAFEEVSRLVACAAAAGFVVGYLLG